MDFSDLPLDPQVTTSGPPQTARDLDDAEQKAGFRPALPESGVLPAKPSLTVIGAMAIEETIHVGELQAALNKTGKRYPGSPPHGKAYSCTRILARW